MVRQALADAQPPGRKRQERERPVLRPLLPFIDRILEADRKAPRKQPHRTSDLAADFSGDAGTAGGGINDPSVRARA
jgi:hypothetical protein